MRIVYKVYRLPHYTGQRQEAWVRVVHSLVFPGESIQGYSTLSDWATTRNVSSATCCCCFCYLKLAVWNIEMG